MVKTLYTEEQKIRQNLLWLIFLITPTFFFWVILLYQLSTGKLVGDRPLSNVPLSIITVIYTTCSLWSLFSIKLTTIIDETKLAYGWNIPTAELNEIPLGAIKEMNIVKYRFVGYGYRISRQYGTVYNVGGNKGLQIVLKSGEKILIGTGQEEQLEEIIARLRLKLT
ncbi:MAG: hypothetical protein JNL60_13085 [Bacteroidia bacterium]|nr:hypothetical protein [Bacteroidia bacterium]